PHGRKRGRRGTEIVDTVVKIFAAHGPVRPDRQFITGTGDPSRPRRADFDGESRAGTDAIGHIGLIVDTGGVRPAGDVGHSPSPSEAETAAQTREPGDVLLEEASGGELRTRRQATKVILRAKRRLGVESADSGTRDVRLYTRDPVRKLPVVS